MLFVYPKHKGTTEDIRVLVSLIYKYAMTSSLRTKPVGGQWGTCKSLVPASRVNQSNFTNIRWRHSCKVRVLGVLGVLRVRTG